MQENDLERSHIFQHLAGILTVSWIVAEDCYATAKQRRPWMNMNHRILLQPVERSLALIPVVDRQLYRSALIGHLLILLGYLWQFLEI